MATDKARVAAFLRELKRIISEERGLDFIPRHENNQTILALGFTKNDGSDLP